MLPGDGIGPEVSKAALKAAQKAGAKHGISFEPSFHAIGGDSIDIHGTPLSEEALEAAKSADAVFLGAVGGPAWDSLTGDMRPESGLLALRKGLQVYANLRPVSVYPAFQQYSPLKSELLDGVDIMVVRELTGGVYFGEPKGPGKTPTGARMAVDTMRYEEHEIRRIAKTGFELAQQRRGKLSSVDKANVLASSRLWRDVVNELSAEYPDVELEHVLVDNCAMQLLRRPADFDVIVTENMFGDILSDEAAMLSGSIGLLPSASIGDKGGLYEPVHGSAPDIAGTGKANPLAAMLSMVMMMRITLKETEAADTLEHAIQETIAAGHRCADLAGSSENKPLSTEEMTAEVFSRI